MVTHQKDMLSALRNCGVSTKALLAIGAVIETEEEVALYTNRLLKAEEEQGPITDGLALQVLSEVITEAMEA